MSRESVLSHLQELGYLDSEFDSIVTEQFIAECIDAINNNSTFSLVDENNPLAVEDTSLDIDQLLQDCFLTTSYSQDASRQSALYSKSDNDNITNSRSLSPSISQTPPNSSKLHQISSSSFNQYISDDLSASMHHYEDACFSPLETKRPAPVTQTTPLNVIERLANLDLLKMETKIAKQKNDAGNHDPRDVNQLSPQNSFLEESLLDSNESRQSSEHESTKYSDYSKQTRPYKSGSGFISPFPPSATAAITRTKKSDPVARFHTHQKQWTRDTFIKRTESRPKPVLSRDHVASRESQAAVAMGVMGSGVGRNFGGGPRVRHDLAAMRPNYVVPSEKLRRDVVWEVRNKMAYRVA